MQGPYPQQQLLVPQDPMGGQQPLVPGGGGQTLGTAQAMGQPANDLLQAYMQALQTTTAMVEPAMRRPIPPQPGPSLAATLGTFGIANLKHMADEATRREQNYVNDQQNRVLQMKAADLAMQAVNSQARSAAIAGQQTMAQARMAIDMAKLGIDMNRAKWDEVLNQHRQIVNETFPAPTSIDQARQYRAQGLGPLRSVPNRWGRPEQDTGGPILPRSPTGGYRDLGEPPAPGSPAATTLGDVGGGGGGTRPADMREGELPEEYAARKDAEDKARAAAAQQKTTANLEIDRNARLVESWLQNPKTDQAFAATLLPAFASSVAGPLYMRIQRKKGETGAAAYLETARTNILPALRALEGGTKGMSMRGGQTMEQIGLVKQFERIANGEASLGEAKQFKQTVLDRLKEVREQMGAPAPEERGGGGPTPLTQPTGATGVTPGGIRFRVIE